MLIAHWSLDGNCRDQANKHNGRRYHVEFVEGVDGRSEGAAYFNGINSYIHIEDHPDFHMEDGDFTVAAWIRAAKHAHPAGDLISKFDANARKGFHLTVGGNSSGYSSISDNRALLFGVDNAIEGNWIDCGKPRADNTLISALVVYKDHLYASLTDALTTDGACRIYRYEGGGQWSDAGRLGVDPRVRSAQTMIVHNGDLYAGTGVWDWTKLQANFCDPSRLFRYLGGTEWEDCGSFGKGQTTVSLASYQGYLYTGDEKGQCYRYDGDGQWEYCGQMGAGGYDDRLNSMTVWQDRLYACSLCDVYVYEGGRTWTRITQQPYNVSQLHKLHVHKGELLLGTWPEGKILRYLGGESWEDLGENGIESKYKINEVNDLINYNGKLYAGVIPKSEVYRFDSIGQWKNMAQLVDNQDWDVYNIDTWNRVPSMATYGGLLYASTSSCQGRATDNPDEQVGKVFSFEAGKSASYDNDIGKEWTHVTAVRSGNQLQLYVDGELVSGTAGLDDNDYNLTNRFPLKIGAGEHHYFKGAVDDLRFYNSALSKEEIQAVRQEKIRKF